MAMLGSNDPKNCPIARAHAYALCCVCELAPIKNVVLDADEALGLAQHVIAAFEPHELPGLLDTPTDGRPCAVVMEANYQLDRLTMLRVFLTFERIGVRQPLAPHAVAAAVDEILCEMRPHRRNGPITKWPGIDLWEQIAAAHVGVTPPTNLTAFGAWIAEVAANV